MDGVHRAADNLFDEVEHLERIMADPPGVHTDLALSQAKRVRRSSTLLVQALAERRDSYSQEAQANVREGND